MYSELLKIPPQVLTQVLGERFIGMVGGVQQLQGLVDFFWLHDFIPEKKFTY
jgi:hypothetical protein